MFIRLKKIQGKYYAYHVQNKRVWGRVKQKVRGYIGRAIFPKKTNDIDFFSFINQNIENYNKDLKSAVKDLIVWELHKHNLENEIKLDMSRETIKKNKKNIVIKLNDGFLYNTTIRNIIRFVPVGDDEYFIGREFAESFVKAGIGVPKELFVKLFQGLMKERGHPQIL